MTGRTCMYGYCTREHDEKGAHVKGPPDLPADVLRLFTDDATVGERGCRWSDARGRWEWEIRPGVSKEACGHLAHTRGGDLYMPDERPVVVTSATPDATPPADDDDRAPVSGGLDEGEQEALVAVVHRAFHEAWNPGKPLNLYADSPIWQAIATAVETRVVERLAAVEGERDLALASAASMDHFADVAERVERRNNELVAERDAARREAGERIAVAIEAEWSNDPGWHPFIRETANHAARIARADAITSDDGSGA